ncbi:hypothetical protein SAMN05444339_1334 [Loktanella atrilutea]|uniref:Transferase hexapeptide (Six repeat-containing protein) n=1 Tax=Loktanella atrilutea TaxID=366533 RepID=A0A1M5G2N6_LOKAT|nr:hypothetical protein [Loktanella atrilutea]SHF98070.1 hypothetical protein SAMN05444339_1334 [Loktanella atrilutea]
MIEILYDGFLKRARSIIKEIEIGDFSGSNEVPYSDQYPITKKGGGAILACPRVNMQRVFGGRKDVEKIICHGRESLVFLSEGVSIKGSRLEVVGQRSGILIGKNVRMKGVTLKLYGDDGLIVIGAESSWESGAALCIGGRSIAIGNDCMFSNGVGMRTNDDHGIWDNKTGKRINPSKDIVVGHHVWLGNGSRLNKGSNVGMGSIVGQFAVVSGDVEAECIYAGIPARKIRGDVHWTRHDDNDDMPKEYRVSFNGAVAQS